ncbi:hypothetical protein F5Y15DRAFT_237445 [Xylariaceae sp. FL0016]|nr:hypothetical protein F5Y15DRAFT_237445 [Xylariaceae sp. FL0016]
MHCYCANYYGAVNCHNKVSRFGDRCKLCTVMNEGASANFEVLRASKTSSSSSSSSSDEWRDASSTASHSHSHSHSHSASSREERRGRARERKGLPPHREARRRV